MMRKNCIFSLLLLGIVLLSLWGCSSDEDELEDLAGTWEIVSINRKTPAEWLLPVIEVVLDMNNLILINPKTPAGRLLPGLAGEDVTTTVTVKKADIVFATNGSIFWNIDAEVEYGISGFFFKFVMDTEVKGTYTVSGATVSWAADASVDFDQLGLSNDYQQEFDSNMKQATERLEDILEEDLDVGLVSAIWELEADVLTLIEDDGDKTVLSREK